MTKYSPVVEKILKKREAKKLAERQQTSPTQAPRTPSVPNATTGDDKNAAKKD